MKTQSLLSALLLVFASITIEAQTLDPVSEWRVDAFIFDPGYYDNTYYKDFIDGDTIINNLEYYKVFRSGYKITEWKSPGWLTYFEHSFHGFIREQNNKWHTFYQGQDEILVDFTLNVGDTVVNAFTPSYGRFLVVTAIDSVIIDGEYKKRLHLNGYEVLGAEYIIEGIGQSTGLFENMLFFEKGSSLVCFAKEGNSLWGASTEECDLAVNINENRGNTDPCEVFPNPAKDFTLLTIPSGLKNVTCKLIDLVGGIVYQKSFESPSTNKILLTTYHSGVYLAVIESNSSKQSVKLIIK
jgi:hypothetical protein